MCYITNTRNISMNNLTAKEQIELAQDQIKEAQRILKENEAVLKAQRQQQKQKLANRSGLVMTSFKIEADTLEKMKLVCEQQGISVAQAFRDFAQSYVKKHLKVRPQQQLDLATEE